MFLINDSERKAILEHFPKAEIVPTRHRYYLVGAITAQEVRFLFSLRGLISPPTRKQKEKSNLKDIWPI